MQLARKPVSIHVPIPEALLTGSDLVAGRYRLEKVLGMGGMGYVVSAIQVGPDGSGPRVAIKFMLPEAMRSQSLHRRFVREVEAIGRLRSEHVCRLLDAGRLPDGAPFMVMEYLAGADLEREIENRGPLPVWEAADYALQVVDAMAEAHSHGIVHRDLKPANVFRAWIGDGSHVIKVLDFGVAKAADGMHSTATNTVMGSPSFMAPEQLVSSKRVDERADIYSIGAVLYFLLTGRAPYDAEQLPALCLKVLNEDPVPPSTHRPDLPREIDDIILTCMAREPVHRYPNVAELAYALLPFAPEHRRALADAAAAALQLVPGGWKSPGRLVSTGAVTVSVRKPEPPADGYATQLVGFSSGGASAESTPTRRRRWVIGLAAAACLGVGIGASALLLRTDGVPAIPESARAEPAPAQKASPASARGEASPAAAMPPSEDSARGERPAADVAAAGVAAADVAAAGVAGADVAAPADKATAETEAAEAQPSSVDASADRETQLQERRKARRQRARARARARRRDAQTAPAPPETATTPDDTEREPDDTAVKPAPCSVDDPLCAFGTAR